MFPIKSTVKEKRMGERVLVTDIGGTNMRIASLKDGEIEALLFCHSIGDLPPREGIEFLKNKIFQFACGEKVEAVVMGFPGLVDYKGRLQHSPNLKAYEGINLKEAFFGLGFKVFFENDANLYALGEGFKGGAKGAKNYCCLTLGTGVGSGVVIDGRLLKGSRGVASEIGHMTVKLDGAPCSCGSKGCLEAYCSGTAILRMARERGLNVESAQEVARLAEMGSEEALSVFEEMGKYLGAGLANMVNIFNPEVILIGGKVSEAFPFFIDKALETMSEMAFPYPVRNVIVKKATLGDMAALWGGWALVMGSHAV